MTSNDRPSQGLSPPRSPQMLEGDGPDEPGGSAREVGKHGVLSRLFSSAKGHHDSDPESPQLNWSPAHAAGTPGSSLKGSVSKWRPSKGMFKKSKKHAEETTTPVPVGLVPPEQDQMGKRTFPLSPCTASRGLLSLLPPYLFFPKLLPPSPRCLAPPSPLGNTSADFTGRLGLTDPEWLPSFESLAEATHCDFIQIFTVKERTLPPSSRTHAPRRPPLPPALHRRPCAGRHLTVGAPGLPSPPSGRAQSRGGWLRPSLGIPVVGNNSSHGIDELTPAPSARELSPTAQDVPGGSARGLGSSRGLSMWSYRPSHRLSRPPPHLGRVACPPQRPSWSLAAPPSVRRTR